MKDVPYIVFETELARMERMVKRLFITVIVLICFLVGTNAYWIWYESQFEDVTTTVEQEATADDFSKAIINDGVHINGGEGTPESHSNQKGSEEER